MPSCPAEFSAIEEISTILHFTIVGFRYTKIKDTQMYNILIQSFKQIFSTIQSDCYLFIWTTVSEQNPSPIFLHILYLFMHYSGCHWKVYECCFIKQNCHSQNRLMQCKNATKPLTCLSIHTTQYLFQKRYITLFLLKGLKSYQPSKFE